MPTRSTIPGLNAGTALPKSPSVLLLSLIVAASIALMLIRPWNIPEAYWVAGGAALLVLLRLTPLRLAGHAVAQGLGVYLFLIGMMLMSELARSHGVFDWLSAAAVNHARGSSVRLFTLVYLIGVVVTTFMSNDATAVVLTPAILPALRRARIDPRPALFACVFIANAASFVLPISNPANLVVFNTGMPPLGQWMRWLALPSLIAITSTYVILRIIFRGSFSRVQLSAFAEARADGPPILGETGESALGGPPPLTPSAKLVLAGLAAMTAVLLAASATNHELGAPTCVCALLVTALVSLRTRSNPLPLFREISWATLLLVAGLFVLVNAVESAGALQLTSRWLRSAQAMPPLPGALLSGLVVGLGNNVVNNLPLGLLAAGTVHAVQPGSLLTNVILVGIDLGPNLSITGSLASILWLIALRREKIEVSFGQFLQVGIFAMTIPLILTLVAMAVFP